MKNRALLGVPQSKTKQIYAFTHTHTPHCVSFGRKKPLNLYIPHAFFLVCSNDFHTANNCLSNEKLFARRHCSLPAKNSCDRNSLKHLCFYIDLVSCFDSTPNSFAVEKIQRKRYISRHQKVITEIPIIVLMSLKRVNCVVPNKFFFNFNELANTRFLFSNVLQNILLPKRVLN